MACALWGASGRSPLRARSALLVALVSAQKNSAERRDELYGFDVLPFNMYWNYCYSKFAPFAKRYFRRTSMLAPSRMAGRLLSSMPPYTEVLCVASTGLHRVGLARSDPYLSKATTMAPARPTALGLRRALYSGAQIGLVIVALPLRGRQSVQQLVLRSRRLLGRTVACGLHAPAVPHDGLGSAVDSRGGAARAATQRALADRRADALAHHTAKHARGSGAARPAG